MRGRYCCGCGLWCVGDGDDWFVEGWCFADDAFGEVWADGDGLYFGELEEGGLEFSWADGGCSGVGDDAPACLVSFEAAVGEGGDDLDVDFVEDGGDLCEAFGGAVEFDVEVDDGGLRWS